MAWLTGTVGEVQDIDTDVMLDDGVGLGVGGTVGVGLGLGEPATRLLFPPQPTIISERKTVTITNIALNDNFVFI